MLTQLSLSLNTADVTTGLSDLERDQLPFATMKAINQTLLDVQQAERVHVAQVFTLRRPQYVLSSIAIGRGDFATKQRLEGAVRVSDKRNLLAKFETGGLRATADPLRAFYLPSVNIQASKAELPERALYPRNLRILERRGVTGTMGPTGRVLRDGTFQPRGKRGTFVLDPRSMHGVKTWGIYQRTGPGKHDVRLLWRFRLRVNIPAILKFEESSTKVVGEKWEPNFRHWLDEAVRTAFPR